MGKYVKTFESWFPKERFNNQEQVVKDYCEFNKMDFNSLTDEDKNNIRKEIGFIVVKVEVVYPPMYMLETHTIQEVSWVVTEKRIYLNHPGRSCSIDRCKILEYKDTFCWVSKKDGTGKELIFYSPLLKKELRPIPE